MRIISQDNMHDIPYDVSVISVSGNYIHAQVGYSRDRITLGKYEDEKTAKDVLRRIVTSYGVGARKVFQMPSNEEFKETRG